MLLIIRLLIDAGVLGFLLAVIGHVDVASNIMRPIAVIFLTAVVGVLAHLIVGGMLWGLAAFAVSVAALYFLVGWLFDLSRRQKMIIVSVYLVLQIAMAFVL